MKKIIFLIFALYLEGLACALCALQTPTAHAKTDFVFKDNNVSSLNVTWNFSSNFTKSLYYSYDKNDDGILNKNELKEIEWTLIDWLIRKNFLTQIYVFKQNEEQKALKIKVTDTDFSFINDQIIFKFNIPLKIKLNPDEIIKIVFEDKEGFFNFSIITNENSLAKDYILEANSNLNSIFYKIKFHENAKNLENSIKKPIKEVSQTKEVKNSNAYYEFLVKKLEYFGAKIKEMFIKSQNNVFYLFLLIAFSFLYGLFHALGPGHGKALVGSYFLANGGNIFAALILSLKVALVHILGAFLLVLASVYFIKTFISALVNDVSKYASIFGGVIVIVLGIYMLLGLRHGKGCSCHACQSKNHDNFKNNLSGIKKNNLKNKPNNFKFQNIKAKNTKISQNKSDWLIAIAAGIVPCPGTIAVFILAFSFGNYLSGFLSALAMTIGMSSVIFIAAVFGNIIHKKGLGNLEKNAQNFQIVGLVFIILLGFFMIFGALN